MQVYVINTDKNKKEMMRHGSFEFPMAVYENVIASKVLGYVNWHWHDELQLVYVTRGTVSLFLSGRTEVLNEGEGMFINSGIMHMAKDMHDSGATYICMDFSPRLLSSFPGSVFESRYVMPIVSDHEPDSIVLRDDSGWQSDVLRGICGIYGLYEDGGYGYELEVMSRLAHIWYLLVKNVSRRNVESGRSGRGAESHHRRLREIVSYIQDHYSEKVTLDDIADHVHLSRNECCRFFKKNMRLTLFEYLLDYRLAKSMELLEDRSLSVTQVAYEAGFGSSSYYIEKFRKKTGMSPGEFRKRRREG